MISKLSLSLSRSFISRYIYQFFNLENEFALSSFPLYQIHPLDKVTIIIGSESSYKLGQLPWGRSSSPSLNTLNTHDVQQSPVFRKHLARNRCLVLVDGFEISKVVGDSTSKYVFKENDQQILFLAGLYFTTVVNKIKSTHVSILLTPATSTFSSMTDGMPVILNPDQYHFWLNPKTLIPELNFLFLPSNFQKLSVKSI